MYTLLQLMFSSATRESSALATLHSSLRSQSQITGAGEVQKSASGIAAKTVIFFQSVRRFIRGTFRSGPRTIPRTSKSFRPMPTNSGGTNHESRRCDYKQASMDRMAVAG